MLVTLNTQTKRIENEKIIIEKGIFEADLDMSLAAQIRYEIKFPELAKNEDLLEYTDRINKVKKVSLPLAISRLKLIYCWFDTELEFIKFVKLFDLTDHEYVTGLTKEMDKLFTLVLTGSAEKN